VILLTGISPICSNEISKTRPLFNDPPNSMLRNSIDKPLALAVRALDGLLTGGEGWRMAIFAAAGGGKTTLLGQIIHNTKADTNVLALVGERGVRRGNLSKTTWGQRDLSVPYLLFRHRTDL
jgi:flagellar biosynthesis/type III secretory pathway ATPase